MSKKGITDRPDVPGILHQAQADEGFIGELESDLKTVKRILKKGKYRALECLGCGGVFLQHDLRQRYCTRQCGINARVKRYRFKKSRAETST